MKNEIESKSEQQANASTNGTNVQRARMLRKPRGFYILQEGEDGPIFRVETAESYAGRKRLTGKVTNVKKLARIARVRQAGYVKRPATPTDILRYGPAITTGVTDETEAA